jgi:hypothetical protein
MKQHIAIALSTFLFTHSAYAERNPKVEQVLAVLSEACLSGTQLRVEYDAEGEVSFRSLKPGAEGSFVLDERNAKGATGILDEQLRLIADDKVRDCMKPHLDTIIGHIFQYSVDDTSIPRYDNTDLRKAILIAPNEGSYTIRSFLPGDGKSRFFRIQTENFANASIKLMKNDNVLRAGFLAPNGKGIKGDNAYVNGNVVTAMLPAGGGYVWVGHYEGKPTIYEIRLEVNKME